MNIMVLIDLILFMKLRTKLGSNSNEGSIPNTHPDYGLPRKLRVI